MIMMVILSAKGDDKSGMCTSARQSRATNEFMMEMCADASGCLDDDL